MAAPAGALSTRTDLNRVMPAEGASMRRTPTRVVLLVALVAVMGAIGVWLSGQKNKTVITTSSRGTMTDETEWPLAPSCSTTADMARD